MIFIATLNQKMIIALLAALLFLLGSCGPSEEEKSRSAKLQKTRQDSLVKAVEYATQQKIESKLRLQDSIQFETAMLEGLRNRLIFVNADLEAAKDRLLTMKQPQFLRTPAEREQQVKNQNIRIANLANEIIEIQSKMQLSAFRLEKSQSSLKNLDK